MTPADLQKKKKEKGPDEEEEEEEEQENKQSGEMGQQTKKSRRTGRVLMFRLYHYDRVIPRIGTEVFATIYT